MTKALQFGIVILFVAPFLFGDSPLPPPYHQYLLQGTILRSAPGAKQNFIVSLVGKFSLTPLDTSELANYPSGITRSVTDSSGQFWLDVKSDLKPDSIAVRVAAFGKPDHVSSFFPSPQANGTVTGVTPGAVSGCFGCTTTGPSTQYVKGYQYQLSNQVVVLPY